MFYCKSVYEYELCACTTLSCLSRLSAVNTEGKMSKTFKEKLCVADSRAYPVCSCCFLALFVSPRLSLRLCSGLSVYRQDCALSTAASDFKAQICLRTRGSELSNKMRISSRPNGFVKAMLRHTDGEERTSNSAWTATTTWGRILAVPFARCQIPATLMSF